MSVFSCLRSGPGQNSRGVLPRIRVISIVELLIWVISIVALLIMTLFLTTHEPKKFRSHEAPTFEIDKIHRPSTPLHATQRWYRKVSCKRSFRLPVGSRFRTCVRVLVSVSVHTAA